VEAHIRTFDQVRGGSPSREVDTTKGKKVSGRVAKVEANVVKAVVWPHSVLELKYVPEGVTYADLDLALLVAGELAIIASRETSPVEARARSTLLKKVAYIARIHSWLAAKTLHLAALSEVERGERSWEDIRIGELTSEVLAARPVASPAPVQLNPGIPGGVLVNNVIPPLPGVGGSSVVNSLGLPTTSTSSSAYTGAFPIQSFVGASGGNQYQASDFQAGRGRPRGRGGRRAPARYFCSLFNRGNCQHNGAHRGTVGNREVLVEHFCAICWQEKREVAYHSEKDCPFAAK
jgi:hypothetical protein